MHFQKAQRKNIPALIAIAGTTGSGKTFSALLVAAGLVGPQGKVAFIDTEMGRGAMYADDPLIMQNLPQGYDILELTPPYSPARYLEAIHAAIAGGYEAIVIDSVSHEFEGEGGISDMAENNKMGGIPNWAMAKKEHKKFINKLLTMPVHIICCLRAREKTKPEKQPDGKIKFIEKGVQPIQEKNFMFEMTFSCLLDPVTHFPVFQKNPIRLPDNKLIGRDMGEKIKAWSEGGATTDLKARELKGKLTAIAYDGMEALKAAFEALGKDNKYAAKVFMDELKKIATEADAMPKDEPGKADIF